MWHVRSLWLSQAILPRPIDTDADKCGIPTPLRLVRHNPGLGWELSSQLPLSMSTVPGQHSPVALVCAFKSGQCGQQRSHLLVHWVATPFMSWCCDGSSQKSHSQCSKTSDLFLNSLPISWSTCKILWVFYVRAQFSFLPPFLVLFPRSTSSLCLSLLGSCPKCCHQNTSVE